MDMLLYDCHYLLQGLVLCVISNIDCNQATNTMLTITITILLLSTISVDSFKPCKIPVKMGTLKSRTMTMFKDPTDTQFESFNKLTNTQLEFSSKPLTGEDAALFSLEQQKVSSWVTFSAGRYTILYIVLIQFIYNYRPFLLQL